MFVSRLLQNTHNYLYRKNKYFYYKLMQNKIHNTHNTHNTIIPHMLPIITTKKYKNKTMDNNTIDNKSMDNKVVNLVKNQTINIKNIFYTTVIGTTIIIVTSTGIYYYIVINHINLLFCL